MRPPSVCQRAFCPLALFDATTGDGAAVAASCRHQVLVGQLLPDLPQTGHGAVDGRRAHQVEVVHAHQMQQEVAAQVAADDVRAAVLHEQHDGLVHLVVCDEAARGGRTRRDS